MTDRKLVWDLAFAHLKSHPVRLALTALAIIATACTVVWVVSGYDALVAKFDDMSDEYLGRYQAFVVPQEPKEPGVDKAIYTAIAKDPTVDEANSFYQFRASIQKPGSGKEGERRSRGEGSRSEKGGSEKGRSEKSGSEKGNSEATKGSSRDAASSPPMRRRATPYVVGIDTASPPYPLVTGNWLTLGTSDEGVLGEELAKQLSVAVGDKVIVRREVGTSGVPDETAPKTEVKIIGLVKQASAGGSLTPRGAPARGAARGPASAALYVATPLAEKISGEPAVLSLIAVKLRDEAAVSDFRNSWAGKLAAFTPAGSFVADEEIDAGLAQSFSAQSARNQAYAATGMSLLASLFIVFTTLSMGVDERIRQFAMLRAIALSRWQIAGIIIIESLLLAIVGWLGGLAAGWALLKLVGMSQPELFSGGALIGTQSIVLSGICALGGACLAAIVPIWKSVRTSPLEAMKPATSRVSALKLSWGLLVLGLVLIAVNPLLVFFAPIEDGSRYAVSVLFGYTSMAIGFLLLAPLCVLAAEKICVPILAPLFRVDRELLSTQLSGNLWRTVGTAVSLTIGLGLFIATQTWSFSMLQPFVPGEWMPDLVVNFPNGVSDEDIAAVRETAGVSAAHCMPIAIEQPKFKTDITRSEEFTNATRADSVVMVGIDPEMALGTDDPMFDFKFLEGSARNARYSLKLGRACLIPDFLQAETGLKKGDFIEVVPPHDPTSVVKYEIAGVVAEPGVHWLTKGSLRRRGGSMAGMVFADYKRVREDFQLKKNDFFWLDLKPGATVEGVQTALEPIALRNGGKAPTDAMTSRLAPPGSGNSRSPVVVKSAAAVKTMITNRAAEVIWGFSQLPLITLLIASIGMINTVMASIRARTWEFGVMRSVGLTRGTLFRMIIAEAVLIGIVACILSFAMGVAAGYCGTGLARYVYRHGGYIVPLTIPWDKFALAFLGTLLICALASLIPAYFTGRKEPLRLLQAGRAAM
jgi:putative ABC transport system permease protein